MPWHAQLRLDYRLSAGRTVLQHAHDGPLRIFKSLYPEGDAVCHNVIVHPPGGLVGGDVLDVDVRVAGGAHALLSTPGATRFYASDEAFASQQVRLRLDPGARLEWLPLETIAYPGCRAQNRWTAELGEGAELMAWDVTALGLPGAQQPYDRGEFRQRLEIPGLWLEQACIRADDPRLLDSPLGLGGRRCLGTLVLASGSALTRERRETLVEVAREALRDLPAEVVAGVTAPNDRLLAVRAVAPLVEPLMAALQAVWARWRPAAWGLPGQAPRIWQV
ncbi:MAG: urease accessory protein UreD [Hydrogenophaga sp.]|nr:urease accessory protein UreD [Hydrogenophaga sp.]